MTDDKTKAEKEAEAAAKAAAKEAEKQRKKAEREAAKAEKQKLKEEEKARKQAEKEASRMPEQNGVRKPKPGTLCGRVWEVADKLSAELGQPTPVKNLLESCVAEGQKPGNIKAEYARWRKFHGVTGRVTLPKEPAEV